MKLYNFLEDSTFNLYRNAMGAPLSSFQLKVTLPPATYRPKPSPVVILPLPTEGLEVSSNEIKTHTDGTLLYKDKRVIVHIRDASGHEPRFHLSNCITLVEMKSAGRFQKYVVSEREDGFFHVRYKGGDLSERQLSVCQNCLDKLSWKGFSREGMEKSTRLDIVKKFSIKEFFKKYPNSLHLQVPQYTVHNAPINEYPENWALIASELKRQLGFYCQTCNRVLGEANKKFLHVHHINGLKNDCRVENLSCLCISCHAEEYQHQSLKTHPDYIQFKNIFP
jgi:hypothetical protein